MVTYISPKGKKRNGNLRNNAGIIIFDHGIITTDINNCAEHY